MAAQITASEFHVSDASKRRCIAPADPLSFGRGRNSPPSFPPTAALVGAANATITTTLAAAATAAGGAKPASIFDKGYGSPIAFSTSDPLVLFITQAFVIVALSRLLHLGLRYLRQPRVIAEIIAGILIGPTALGRVPGFTANIFPPQSIPYLNLVANIGLTLFLFLVGLEVDFSLFRRNAQVSIAISLIGMIIPFAMGAAVSKGIYDRFIDESTVNFGTFLLFLGTANAITAFPVLARILTDEGLLKNHVGVIVLSAGVGSKFWHFGPCKDTHADHPPSSDLAQTTSSAGSSSPSRSPSSTLRPASSSST